MSDTPTQIDDGGQAFVCARCHKDAYIKQGRQWLCKKHYRFGQMIAKANSNNKVAPTHETLESLSDDMDCFGCGREMVWLSKEDASRVVSLQHDRNGDIRFLCRSCNSRHARYEGDQFYKIPDGMAMCHDCKEMKNESEFATDNRKVNRRKTYCRPCSARRHKSWRDQRS